MQMKSIVSVNHGTSLCLGIVWVKISRTPQLNEGPQQQENFKVKLLRGRVL